MAQHGTAWHRRLKGARQNLGLDSWPQVPGQQQGKRPYPRCLNAALPKPGLAAGAAQTLLVGGAVHGDDVASGTLFKN